MSNGKFKMEAEHDYQYLNEIMYSDVLSWLDQKIWNFLIDYLNIKTFTDKFEPKGLSDYSYLITPAFKALEGTLLQIGTELGFKVEEYKFRVGVIFNEENLEKYYEDVLEKISSLSEEKKVDIKQWLDNARRILKSLRHTPAHYNGEVKQNITKAFLSGDLIISTINEMCHAFIENDLFPSIVKKRLLKQAEAEEKRRFLAKRLLIS